MHTLLGLALVTQLFTQAGKPQPLDVTAYKANLKAVTDGLGHYIVFDSVDVLAGHLFYGDGKTFFTVPVFGGGANGSDSFDLSFWDPRVTGHSSTYASFDMRDSGRSYVLSCNKKEVPFKPVPDADLGKVLSGASFFPRKWTRRPERLLRDDKGTYYFVDRLRTESDEDRRDFRVFVGPRGKLKQVPLKDIIDDSKGTILATATGQLRLIVSPEENRWVEGKDKTVLTDVPVTDNARLIYNDLGPYTGQPLGTPCDDNL